MDPVTCGTNRSAASISHGTSAQNVHAYKKSEATDQRHLLFTPSPILPAMPKVIISFKNDISDADMDKAICNIKASGGTVKDDYRPLMKAIAAEIPESYVSSLSGDELVKNIEPDGIVTTQDA